MKEMEAIAERLRNHEVRNQWSYPVPGLEKFDKPAKEEYIGTVLPKTTKELAVHLRDFCFVSTILHGKQGATASIPYVTDFDFEVLSAVGDAFSDSLGTIYGTTVAGLKEAGGWARIPYKDLERIDANMMDEINKAFGRAGIRAEDKIILDAVENLTTSQFAGVIDRDTATAAFHAESIPKAIGKLLEAGKEADPGECVCYLTPAAYGALLAELSASQPAAFATPNVLKSGRVTEYMGVHLVVGPAELTGPPRSGGTGTCYACVLGRFRRGVVIAPKRDILIETEKDTVTRSTKITGSHTVAVKIIDGKELVRINTSETA